MSTTAALFTVELIVETMSMKPKALVVEDGNKSKLKIRASSWIEKITKISKCNYKVLDMLYWTNNVKILTWMMV
jgi:hypothetical protein